MTGRLHDFDLDHKGGRPGNLKWRALFLIPGVLFTVVGAGGFALAAWFIVSAPFDSHFGLKDLDALAFGVVMYLVVAVAFGGYGLAMLKASRVRAIEQIPLVGGLRFRWLVTASTIAVSILACLLIALIFLLANMEVP